MHRSSVGHPPAYMGITRLGHHLASAPGLLLRLSARRSLAVEQEGGTHLFVQFTKPRHSQGGRLTQTVSGLDTLLAALTTLLQSHNCTALTEEMAET